MNAGLTREINMRVKPGDRVIHVGDFATKGKVNGIPGLSGSYTEFLSGLNGTWSLLEGNHDKQGKVKTIGKHLFCHLGGFPVFVSHLPTDNENQDPLLIDYVRRACAFAICGHVHDAWTVKTCAGIVNINVGVDVHKYRPISDDEVLGIYTKETRK